MIIMGRWADAARRREYFTQIAKDLNFDPLLAANWRHHSAAVRSTKHFHAVLRYHAGHIHNAITELFPDVNWDAKNNLLYRGANAWNDVGKRREFFEVISKEHNLDWRDPKQWLAKANQLSSKDLYYSMNISAILVHHGKTLQRAVMELFPELEWNKSPSLAKNPFMAWTDPADRRKFFEDIAKENNFDPLLANNWFKKKAMIIKTKNAYSVISYHRMSVLQALMDLFPDIDWCKHPALNTTALYADPRKRREFLEKFAQDKAFDPLVPRNWISFIQKNSALLDAKAVLKYHDGSIVKALSDLFPELDWTQLDIYRDAANRRKFFENFAKDNQFDPLKSYNWYNRRRSIIKIKHANTVLSHHGNSVFLALSDLFPEVDWESQLRRVRKLSPMQ